MLAAPASRSPEIREIWAWLEAMPIGDFASMAHPQFSHHEMRWQSGHRKSVWISIKPEPGSVDGKCGRREILLSIAHH